MEELIMNRLTTKGKIVFGIIGILIIVLFTTAIILIFSPKNNKNNDKSNINTPTTNAKYNEKAINVMKDLNLYEKINKKDYSKTIEMMLENNALKEEYLDSYYKINYFETNDFFTNTNKLLEKEYTAEEINYIFNNFKSDIDILLNMKHINILDFKDITNFDINKLERYLNYMESNTNYDTKTVITYVNIGLDLEGYSKYSSYTIEEAENDLTILVNKYHKLPDNYEPSDLVGLTNNSNYKLRKEAAEAFEKLTNAALKDNVIFYPFSAYRSFKTQNTLYSAYKARDGQKEADTYSARPGFSEHQLGLAVDVRSNTLTSNLTNEHYKWMLDNSYKYGFIVRYPKGKQHITQFIEEPWHIRYLGIELATKVHDSGLTYDEYYDIYMEKR